MGNEQISVHTIVTGTRFGRIVVQYRIEGSGKARFAVKCDCGTTKIVLGSNLVSGVTASCGCYRTQRIIERNTKHGHTSRERRTPEYEAWQSMLSRCYDPKVDSYPYYGGKGVTVCARWRESFSDFLSDLGQRPSDTHVLSRRHKRIGFTPTNTLWAPRSEADRNKVNTRSFTVNGMTKCLEDWAAESGINKSTLHYRLSKGLTMRESLDLGHGRQGKRITT